MSSAILPANPFWQQQPPQYSSTQISKPVRPVEQLDLEYGISLEIGKAVQEIEAIFVQQDAGRVYVWILVPNEDEAVSHRVYAKERELMDLFDAVDFKFRILVSEGKPPKSVMTDQNPKLVYVR